MANWKDDYLKCKTCKIKPEIRHRTVSGGQYFTIDHIIKVKCSKCGSEAVSDSYTDAEIRWNKKNYVYEQKNIIDGRFFGN